MMFHQKIVRRRAPLGHDGHGNEIRDWDASETTTMRGVNVQPSSQDEDTTARRTSVVTGWRVQSAPGVDLDIVATDRVVIDGLECEVVGEVARWPHPITGGIHHVEFEAERREG